MQVAAIIYANTLNNTHFKSRNCVCCFSFADQAASEDLLGEAAVDFKEQLEKSFSSLTTCSHCGAAKHAGTDTGGGGQWDSESDFAKAAD